MQGFVRFGWVWRVLAESGRVWQGFGKVWVGLAGLAGFGGVWQGLAGWDHMIVDGVVPRVRVPGRFRELLVAMEVFKSICLGAI